MAIDNELFRDFLDDASPTQLLEKAQDLLERMFKDLTKYANGVTNLGSDYCRKFIDSVCWLNQDILDEYEDYHTTTEVDGGIRIHIDFDEFREEEIRKFVKKIKEGFYHMELRFNLYINSMWREDKEEESIEENEQ